MDEQGALQNLLHEALLEMQLKNPSYSLRAFSSRLGLGSSALSEILNGKRRVSKKLAARLADRLYLDPKMKNSLLEKFPLKKRYSKREGSIKRDSLQLSVDQFHIISDWYHFAILSLMETEDFKSDPAWISKRLRISQTTVHSALERLLRLGMVEKASNGNFTSTGICYSTTDEIKNLSLRKSHAQSLELARASLESDPIDKRDFMAMTMAVDPEKLVEAKKVIREFFDELSELLDSGRKKEVYKFCMQCIPLTKKEE